MMQFRAIKILLKYKTKKDFGMDLVDKREIHCVLFIYLFIYLLRTFAYATHN